MKYDIRYLIGKTFQVVFNPSAINNSKFDDNVYIGKSCQIVNSSVGRYTYINSNCAVAYAKIGSFCSIASGTMIGGGNHPIEWVSTSPVFHKGKNAFNKHFSEHDFSAFSQTVIGNDVWIGAHSIIKAGVLIGDGAVIGMGSVVTHDVTPYSIVAGNPAKVIRKRFDDKTISELVRLQWWNMEEDEIIDGAKFIKSPKQFIEQMKRNNANRSHIE